MSQGQGIHDKATVANGGIDLNQINVQFDQAQLNALEQGGFSGFSFKIESMIRISSPFKLLGKTPIKNRWYWLKHNAQGCRF